MNIDPDINDAVNNNSYYLEELLQEQRDTIAILRARVISLEVRLASLESACENNP